MESPTAGRDFYHRLLPPMATEQFPSVQSVYKLGNIFQITRPKNTHPFIEILKIKVIKPIEVADEMNSQSFLAQIEDGPSHFNGRTVFIKVYDPLYVNPDHLKTICTSALGYFLTGFRV